MEYILVLNNLHGQYNYLILFKYHLHLQHVIHEYTGVRALNKILVIMVDI